MKIFVSYRRLDSGGYAGRLCADLRNRFGDGNVFMDAEIRPGKDYVAEIIARIADCDVFLAVVGRSWIEARHANGQRRLDDEDDLVRQEVAAALAHDVLVIPVLVQNAAMPGAAELPDQLKAFANRQAHVVSDKRWDADVVTLVASMTSEAPLMSRVVGWLRFSDLRVSWMTVAGAVALLGAYVLWAQRVPHASWPIDPRPVSSPPVDGARVTGVEGHGTVLILPFDATEGHMSYQMLSRVEGKRGLLGRVATHWTYWSNSGDLLADLFVCLLPKATVVADVMALQNRNQSATDPTTVAYGPVTNLAGEKGVVVITPYEADEDKPEICSASQDGLPLRDPLVGKWTITNTVTGFEAGGAAAGISAGASLGLNGFEGDLTFQSPNPQDLRESRFIMIAVGSGRGPDGFGSELGPLLMGPDGTAACCKVSFHDNRGVRSILPDVCQPPVGFSRMSAVESDSDGTSLIPAAMEIATSGELRLTNCRPVAAALDDTMPRVSRTLAAFFVHSP